MDSEWELCAGPMGWTEGPAWDGESLLFTDIPNSRIMAYDPEADSCEVYIEEAHESVGMKMGPDDELYACQKSPPRVARIEDDKSMTPIADGYEGDRLNAPNDLCFDSQGRLWFTDPYYITDHSEDLSHLLELGHKSVYRVDPIGGGEWEPHRVTYDTTNPNGILVSVDETRLFVAETNIGDEGRRQLWSYPILDDGTLGGYEVLHNFFPHRGIDGMTLDQEGRIYATAGSEESGPGSMLYVFNPDGRVLETIPCPVKPSNCTFGDDDLQTLYLTGGGCLYRMETDRTGFLDNHHRS